MLVKSGCWWQFLGIGERISLLVTSFECWCLSPTSVSNIRHRHRSFIKLYVSKIGHLADEGAIELKSLSKLFINYQFYSFDKDNPKSEASKKLISNIDFGGLDGQANFGYDLLVTKDRLIASAPGVGYGQGKCRSIFTVNAHANTYANSFLRSTYKIDAVESIP